MLKYEKRYEKSFTLHIYNFINICLINEFLHRNFIT